MSTIGRRSKISCSRSRSYSTSCYPAVTQNGPPRRTHAENEGVGERGRNRTFNLLIKSQLLCQLSYAPACEEKLRKTKENYSRAIGDCFRCREKEWCSLLATPAQVVASKLSRRSEHMPGSISTSAIAKGFLLDGQWINDGAVAEI